MVSFHVYNYSCSTLHQPPTTPLFQECNGPLKPPLHSPHTYHYGNDVLNIACYHFLFILLRAAILVLTWNSTPGWDRWRPHRSLRPRRTPGRMAAVAWWMTLQICPRARQSAPPCRSVDRTCRRRKTTGCYSETRTLYCCITKINIFFLRLLVAGRDYENRASCECDVKMIR